jgi:hypothetical protein
MPIPLSEVELAENGDRRLAKKEELMVGPDRLPIRRHG